MNKDLAGLSAVTLPLLYAWHALALEHQRDETQKREKARG